MAQRKPRCYHKWRKLKINQWLKPSSAIYNILVLNHMRLKDGTVTKLFQTNSNLNHVLKVVLDTDPPFGFYWFILLINQTCDPNNRNGSCVSRMSTLNMIRNLSMRFDNLCLFKNNVTQVLKFLLLIDRILTHPRTGHEGRRWLELYFSFYMIWYMKMNL